LTAGAFVLLNLVGAVGKKQLDFSKLVVRLGLKVPM